ncbi:MAG: hypothetical protein PHR29_05260 [Acholeplasmataceae bacterium]|nr:hypothetical protein [Acholeplasmataceae bacterium]
MASTYTTKLGLAKPANGDVDWHIPINGNWDDIDSMLGPLYEDITSGASALTLNKDVDATNHDLLNVNNFSASTFKTKQCVASSNPDDERINVIGPYGGGSSSGNSFIICRLPPYTWESINSFEISFTLTQADGHAAFGVFSLIVGNINRGSWITLYGEGSKTHTATITNVSGSQLIVGQVSSGYVDTTAYVSNIKIRAVDQDRIINLTDIPSTWTNW